MALLNKLFFPSATSTSTEASASASALTTVQQSTTISSAGTRSAGAATASANSAAGKRQNNNQTVHSTNYLSQFPFDGRQVRVLLYRECDNNGRRLLFDSNALQKVLLKESNGNVDKGTKYTRHTDKPSFASSTWTHRIANNSNNKQHGTNKLHSNNFIEVCEEYGYRHNRPNSTDITSVGEMVFGALAMSFRGTALKVHWLPEPSRILCSQVFLTPINNASNGGQSPYSTISMSSLVTPRTSISSEPGSIDGFSMNSFSMPFSVNVGRRMSLTPSDRSSMSFPVDVPDQQSLSTNSDSIRGESGPRFSSTYSTGTDSGYSGMSRSQLSSDQWSASYQYSTRSSLGSVMSEHSDPLRKHSIDSQLLDEIVSDGSLQRRISRNLRTSFENEYSMNDLIGFISDNYPGCGSTNGGGSEGGRMGVPNYRRASYCANESRSNPEMGKRRDTVAAVKSMTRRARLGLAVCITMSESYEEEMELFCSEHIALLESMLSRLRASAERAYINHKEFLQTMYQAWQETQQWFNDLFTAPRIKCPVWLSITTSGSKYSKNVAERFIKELCSLLSFADTKDTNFFISTMLTAILTHHLGWVSTVSAFNTTSSRTETSAAAIEQRAKLLQVSQKHPYNALWAQMGDLFGAIGLPPKLTRTVIYGTEKLSVERLLNILTYFIRCGEVRRSPKREDFNQDAVNAIVCQNNNNNNKAIKKSAHQLSRAWSSSSSLRKSSLGEPGCSIGGLVRTQTCKQNLNTICDNCELSNSDGEGDEVDETEIVRTHKKNEIPNVLAFRDSRFVQQELRIGNYLMDTGIEKNSLLQNQAKSPSSASVRDGRIRFTVTTPDNVEMNVEDENSSLHESDGALEAIEIDAIEGDAATVKPKMPQNDKNNFFWNMAPVKEGLSLSDIEKLQNGVRVINRKLDNRRSSSFCNNRRDRNESNDEELQTLGQSTSHLSLSDLITQNSMGKSDRMTWGIEPIKENVSLEEQIHFDFCHKQIEREHGLSRNEKNNSSGVVFVLGDNEPLVNLKRSTEDIATESQQPQTRESQQSNCQTLCALHQRTHGPASTQSKKHSGVKFNFEQYPQIATNYMRSKNLVMSNYDLLMDKCSKLEAKEASMNPETDIRTSISNLSSTSHMTSTLSAPVADTETATTSSTTACVVCNSVLNSYQTPSNATELEFEADDMHCYPPMPCTSSVRTLHTVSSEASVDTLKSMSHGVANKVVNETKAQFAQPQVMVTTTSASNTTATPLPVKKQTYSSNSKKVSSRRGSISSVAAKCAAANEAVRFLRLPVPGVKELPQDDEPPGDMKLRAGFIPSLFLNVSDHYISDMVLQGTLASPAKWETNLRQDLALAAHSASLISLPAENVAIVADMVKWDVSLISSQSPCFPQANAQNAPVGMSQLVSSMLETVQAMNSAGISAYECLSFLEAKLQEIYLQSETLAAFLLETDFCSLSAVTTALNLSENDVPLLLSIASIHTPQIARKCGISFK